MEELEKYIFHGLFGPYETKRGERSLYLGHLKERVIKALTKEQVKEPWLYEEIIKAIHHEKAHKVVVDGGISPKYYHKYEKAAKKAGIRFKISSSSRYKGKTGLIVLATEPLANNKVNVPSRRQKYEKLGIPLPLKGNRKKKVCAKCLSTINLKAPELSGFYRRLSFTDRLLGEKCECRKTAS